MEVVVEMNHRCGSCVRLVATISLRQGNGGAFGSRLSELIRMLTILVVDSATK